MVLYQPLLAVTQPDQLGKKIINVSPVNTGVYFVSVKLRLTLKHEKLKLVIENERTRKIATAHAAVGGRFQLSN